LHGLGSLAVQYRPDTHALYLDVVDWGLATVGLTLLLVAAVSRRLVNTPITPVMAVVAVGVLAGSLVLDDLTLGPTSSTVRRLAEATLAVVLFSDSSRINLRALRREASLPVRLLGIGLPLTIVLGALVALALFGSFSLSGALILGVVLAPTDAGLGSAVVTDTRRSPVHCGTGTCLSAATRIGLAALDLLEGSLERGVEVLAIESLQQAVTQREVLETAAHLRERQVGSRGVELVVELLEHLGGGDVDIGDGLAL
jgi:hypothetical protein